MTEYSPSDEYNALRDELLQSKKYVFERPLLIITVALGSLNFIEKAYIVYLPPIAIGLLMFNLWVTVNRMKSMARIVAYIQLELEEKCWRPWLGWETCLRYYRKWIKKHQKNQKELIAQRLDQNLAPDAIGYYHTIFIMHVTIVFILFIGSLLSVVLKPSWYTSLFFVFTIIAVAVFTYFSWCWRPQKCLTLLEEERIRWNYIFEELASEGIKTRNDNRTIRFT